MFFLLFGACALAFYQLNQPILFISPYPNGLNFAFSITDDPDGTRLAKVRPIYQYLDSLGMKTTIACWAYTPRELENMPDPDEQMRSETLENNEYRDFLREYQGKGFEISLHTVTSGHDKREATIKGYERFKDVFGSYPEINIMHSKNKENLYWGKNTFKNPLMKMLVGLYDKTAFSGEDPQSPYFWGDICKEKTKYVRLWGTSDINTLKFNPSMPYHDATKPSIPYLFSFSDGYTARYFNKLLKEENINTLIRERGACIVYTHFAAGFCVKGADGNYILNDETRKKLGYLASQRQGWFVPVSRLLERLRAIKNISVTRKRSAYSFTNHNPFELKGLTLVTKPYMAYIDTDGKLAASNEDGEIQLRSLLKGETKTIKLKESTRIKQWPKTPGLIERVNLAWQRIKIMLFSHRG